MFFTSPKIIHFQKSSFFKQNLINKIQQKTREIKDPDIKKLLNRCFDALNNSPLQTYPETQDIDITLNNTIDNLCEKIIEGNREQIEALSNQVIYTIQERNLIIKVARLNNFKN